MPKLKTVNIQGKEYVTVNERLKEFRTNDLYAGYALESEWIKVDESVAIVRAVIRDNQDDGRIVATGTAMERAGDSFINKTSHVENAETSAWGRALGNLGIGIDTSVATADEMKNARASVEPQQAKKAPPKPAPKAPPSVTKVMEALTECPDEAKLTKVYNRAFDFRWQHDEATKINECYLAKLVLLTGWLYKDQALYNAAGVPMAAVYQDAASLRLTVDKNAPIEPVDTAEAAKEVLGSPAAA